MKNIFSKLLCVLILTLMTSLVIGCASAEEHVLVDNDEIVIRIDGFGEDPLWGDTMNLYLENKTDKLLMFAIDSCSINGVMNDPFWAKELMAGSKASDQVSWLTTDGNVDATGITKLDISFKVYNSEDWMEDAILEESFTVYPQGEDAVVLAEYEPSATDIVLFDNDQASMLVTGFENDELWGFTANVYLVNKTDKTLMFAITNATVNGFMCDPFWACEVSAGTSGYSSVSWLPESFEENGITQAEEIVLSMTVSDADDWMAEDILAEDFTIIP